MGKTREEQANKPRSMHRARCVRSARTDLIMLGWRSWELPRMVVCGSLFPREESVSALVCSADRPLPQQRHGALFALAGGPGGGHGDGPVRARFRLCGCCCTRCTAMSPLLPLRSSHVGQSQTRPGGQERSSSACEQTIQPDWTTRRTQRRVGWRTSRSHCPCCECSVVLVVPRACLLCAPGPLDVSPPMLCVRLLTSPPFAAWCPSHAARLCVESVECPLESEGRLRLPSLRVPRVGENGSETVGWESCVFAAADPLHARRAAGTAGGPRPSQSRLEADARDGDGHSHTAAQAQRDRSTVATVDGTTDAEGEGAG